MQSQTANYPPIHTSRQTYNAATRDPVKKVLYEMLRKTGHIVIEGE